MGFRAAERVRLWVRGLWLGIRDEGLLFGVRGEGWIGAGSLGSVRGWEGVRG